MHTFAGVRGEFVLRVQLGTAGGPILQIGDAHHKALAELRKWNFLTPNCTTDGPDGYREELRGCVYV